MKKKEVYLGPTTKVYFVQLRSLLMGSVNTGTSTGESLTEDTEYDPW